MSSRLDPTHWMWAEAFDLINRAERLHRQFFRLGASDSALAMWEPPVDVVEDDGEIVVVVAMPGVPAERVEVIREPGALIVRGVRAFPVSGSRRRVLQLEIPYGAFERRIPLPSGPLDVGSPELIQGCLIVRLIKLDQAR